MATWQATCGAPVVIDTDAGVDDATGLLVIDVPSAQQCRLPVPQLDFQGRL